MYWGLLAATGVAFSASTEFVPELNEYLQLTPFDADCKFHLTATMIADFAGCWLVEKILMLLFADYAEKDIARRRPDQLAVEQNRRDEAEAKRLRELEAKAGKA